MAYNTKEVVKDVEGNPISQYYNPDEDRYEPVEGRAGANRVILYNSDGSINNSLSLIPILDKLSQLTGTVIDEETRKSNELQRIALYNQIFQMLQDGELKGDKGDIGKGLEFNWQGTSLGVRIEGDVEYIYVDLRGLEGPQGPPGNIENLTKQHVVDAVGYLPVKSVNNEPPDENGNVEVQTGTSDGIPKGVIVMWSGTIANIPQGWVLCDGSNETPNLTDRFIMGATTDATINKTGGQNEVTLTKEQMPAHNHSGSTGSAGGHTHDYNYYGTQASANSTSGSYLVMSDARYASTTSNGAHTHTFSTNNTGGSQAHENRPAYYTLAFIIKL